MKRNDFAEIKNMDVKSLLTKAKGLKEEIVSLTMDKNMKKLKDTKAIFKKKKDLAQVLTIARQKELLAQLEKVTGEDKK